MINDHLPGSEFPFGLMKKPILVFLQVVIGVLIALRLFLIIPAFEHPERFNDITDSQGYLDLAQGLLVNGRFHSVMDPTLDILRTPGYPAFLAVIRGIFGDYRWASAVQLLMSIINCYLIFRIGSYIDQKQRVSYAAVILYLLSLNAAFDALMIMTETLTSFMLILALWMLVEYWMTGHLLWLSASGLVLGLGALVRPSVLPVMLVWFVLFACVEIIHSRKGGALMKALTPILVFCISCYLLVFLWQIRNLFVTGSFTFSHVGTSTLKYWVVGQAIAEIEGISRGEAESLINSAPDAAEYILAFIRTNFDRFALIQARGVIRTVIGVEYRYWAEALTGVEVASSGIVSGMSLNPSLVVDQIRSGNFWVLMGLFSMAVNVVLYSLIGLSAVRVYRKRRENLFVFSLFLIAILTVVYSILVPFGHGSARFRVPVEPILALLAGMAFYGTRVPKKHKT
jgi:4-amino-4-deoxy-L-arabinose transferase-like glycosyltransferase